MKVYKINNLFLFGGSTKEKNPYLVIGKHYQPEQAIFILIKNMLDNFTAPSLCSPKMLDSLLAAVLMKVKPRPLLIGCTIQIPGISGPAGGVLGSPCLPAESAKGELENLQDDWKLLSFAGSPGLAFKEGVKGTFHPKVKAVDVIGKQLLLDLASQAYYSGVEEFLALTDGTGSGAAGSAIIQSGSDYLICSLNEITGISK